MPRTKDNVHIPLKTDEALTALLKIKPTKKMPRTGAKQRAKAKKRPSA